MLVMCETKCELEDVSLGDDEPRVLGKSTHLPKAVPQQLPAISITALQTDAHKPQRCKPSVRRMLLNGAKFLGIGSMVLVLLMAASGWPEGLVRDESARSHVMSALFFIGLLMVALEDIVEVNKSAIVLLLAATLWTMLAMGYEPSRSEAGAYRLHHELDRGLRDVGSVVLFLLPAMGVVESIDHFGGFDIVTVAIRSAMAGRKDRLTPIICILTFLLSSVIDNLTSTIVAIKILRHVAADDNERRKRLGGLAVIAANAGGAWSPIGDVTTTMLWIQGKITAPQTVLHLFFPSLVSGLFPLAGMYWMSCRKANRKVAENKAKLQSGTPTIWHANAASSGVDDDVDDMSFELEDQPLRPDLAHNECDGELTRTKVLSLVVGILTILLVPFLKIWTGLPPYLGMLLALGLMWLVSDLLHFDSPATDEADEKDDNSTQTGVMAALYKVDLSGLLFFTGILLSVGALDSAGVLHTYATMMVDNLGHSPVALCTLLGLSSAVVDNVPLVEASIDMFSDVPTDDRLWQLVALAAGTGGSILSVGSIAGVTLMSMERIGFLWYCKQISLWAFLGFIFGIATYVVQGAITGS